MSAVSRGLISSLRILAAIPKITTTSASTPVPNQFCFFLRRLSTADALVDVAPKNSSEQLHRMMSQNSKRTGVIAVKCGMTALWDKWGARVPITILWVDDNIVSQVKTVEKEGITALQIGCGQKKAKHLTKPEVGHFRAQGVPLKRKLREFPVTEDALLPVGTSIGVRHFVPGQFVDVTGITRGKGFQGVMKRHGFRGMPASHGASLSHRSLGSTGQRDAPGKVPGAEGSFVFVKDAVYKKPNISLLPFPTYFADEDEDMSELEPLVADLGEVDPFMVAD
ncbi:50S ribosomal protein L3-2, mitochondrial-like isoform X2 [Carya illinoinensis]|uniref:50S ribosomal protein L3-2, mitochondrial-like isoform X2 n=1 Tax=Carya illinoinensis TaxID=32201 RepID=UPI001C717D26|nr:50S ribosomal protein L3-2, mitochondrial-like isoform X2 [Carya illinoinensis]